MSIMSLFCMAIFHTVYTRCQTDPYGKMRFETGGYFQTNPHWVLTQDQFTQRTLWWSLSCRFKAISGWWYTYPSEKYESQLGSLFPIYGKITNVPSQKSDTVLFGSKPNRGFLNWRYPYSPSRSLDQDLASKAMVTWGSPILRNPQILNHQF